MESRKRLGHEGFTLVEIIIAFAIISIVAMMMMSFFTHGLKVVNATDKTYKANQETSIAAYRAGELVKNASRISMTSVPGYTKLDIPSLYPTVTGAQYTLEETSGKYLLKYTLTHTDGYSTESTVLLSNVKTAVPGTATAVWYLTSEAALTAPAMSVGTTTGFIYNGSGGTATITIDTINIDDGNSLTVAFDGTHTGLSISDTTPTVNGNETTITVTGTAIVSLGNYPFTVSYAGADSASGAVYVIAKAPRIEVEENTTIMKGSVFDPMQGVEVLDADGDLITPTPAVDVGGDFVNTSLLGVYNVNYNCTVDSVAATEVLRRVTVTDSGVTPVGISNLNVTNIEKNTPFTYSPIGTGGSGDYSFTFSDYGTNCVVIGSSIKWTPPNGANKSTSFKVTITDSNDSENKGTFSVSLKTK